MNPDELRRHLRSLSPAALGEVRALRAQIVEGCWPGGSHDRFEPSAREWLRRWHPERAGIGLPRCACATGRCGVCN